MADKTPGMNAGRDDLTDSDLPAADPFAELTRIMGFDPRKADGGTRTAAQASSIEDFKIDLEQELIREFGEDEPDEEIVASAPEVAFVPEPVFDEPLRSLELQPNDDEAEFDAVQADLEQAVAAFDETPVKASVVVDAEDLMAAELVSEESQAVEKNIPVIKLSPVAPEPEEIVLADELVIASAPEEVAGEAELEAEFNALLGNSEHHEILDTSADTMASVAQTSEQVAHEAPQAVVSIAQPEDDFSVDFGFSEPVEALDKVPQMEVVEFVAEGNSDELLPLEAEVESEEIVAAAEEEVQPVAEVKAQEPAAAEEDDPFAMLAAMAQKYRVSEPNDTWRSAAPQYSRATTQITRTEPQIVRAEPQAFRAEPHAAYIEPQHVRVEPQAPLVDTPAARVEMPQAVAHVHAASVAPMPEIETIDVPDRAIALADDLDIPELELAEELPVVTPADDLDAEFNNLLQQMSTPAVAAAAVSRPSVTFAGVASRPVPAPYQPQPSHDTARAYGEQEYDEAYEEQPAAQNRGYAQSQAAQAPAQPYRNQPQSSAPAYDERSYSRPVAAHAHHDPEDLRIDLTEDDLAEAFDDFDTAAMDDFDLDGDFEDDIAPAAYQQQAYRKPKRRGILIAAIIGGVAILGVAGAVAMSMMGDAQGSAPELVKADQDPFRVRPENPGGTALTNEQGKVYDTVARDGDANAQPQEKLITNTEVPVDLPDQLPENADDDLALSEDDAPKSEDRIQSAVAEEGQTADGEAIAVAPRKVRTMVVKPDGSLAPREDAEPQAQNEVTAPLPGTDDVAGAIDSDDQPAKPAELEQAEAQPENVAPEQTASIQPQPVVEGGWTMQIASESSEAAAKSTYQKMLGRYGNVLDGKGVNIIKADIAGKGTFWRIRIPAESRDAAASLCNNFKSVGGKCFVTKS